MRPATAAWAEQLAGWAVPPDIEAQAPESPWGFLPGMFTVEDDLDREGPSARLAREGLGVGGSVLDVGCGGGAASLALVPPATSIEGVDERAASLTDLLAAASALGVSCRGVAGRWPDAADQVSVADVVVCHHVIYNVADLEPFVAALTAKARRLVVVELAVAHPLTYLRPLWRQFWDLDRPGGPTAADALAVLRELGLDPVVEVGHRPGGHWRSPEQQVHLARKRLCLPADRDAEVAEALDALPLATDEVWTLAWTP